MYLYQRVIPPCRYLQERGIKDVEVVNLDMKEKREHKSDEFKKVTFTEGPT